MIQCPHEMMRHATSKRSGGGDQMETLGANAVTLDLVVLPLAKDGWSSAETKR